MDHQDFEPEFLAETDNYVILRTEDEDDTIYHVELGSITLHFTSEEWEEFVLLVRSVK